MTARLIQRGSITDTLLSFEIGEVRVFDKSEVLPISMSNEASKQKKRGVGEWVVSNPNAKTSTTFTVTRTK